MLAGLLARQDRVCPVGHCIVEPVDSKLLAEEEMALQGGRGYIHHDRRPLRPVFPVAAGQHIVSADPHGELVLALFRLAVSEEEVLAAAERRTP